MDNNKNLKTFFIKLISISLAIIIILNVLFNLTIPNLTVKVLKELDLSTHSTTCGRRNRRSRN